MSDESPASPQPYKTPAVLSEHYCEHPGCAKWGAFGYARGKGESRWYCYAHRDDGEAYRSNQAASAGGSTIIS